MKSIRQLLIISFLISLTGLTGKSITYFAGAQSLFALSTAFYILLGFLYIILAIARKKHRLEAAMIAFSHPMVLGILFSVMHWKGGGVLTVIGSAILTCGSIILFVRTISKKEPALLPMLYLAIGLGATFFCFKFMLWSDNAWFFVPVPVCTLLATRLVLTQKPRIRFSEIALLILIGLLTFTFTSSDSQVFRFKHLVVGKPEINHPEMYHLYAWYLYQEGDIEAAEKNLQQAIEEFDNPNNLYFLGDHYPVHYVDRYHSALNRLKEGNWTRLEKFEPAKNS